MVTRRSRRMSGRPNTTRVLSSSLFLELRAGAYHSVWAREGKSSAPRMEDIGNNFVSGGVWGTDLRPPPPAGERRAELHRSRAGAAATTSSSAARSCATCSCSPFTGFTQRHQRAVACSTTARRLRWTSISRRRIRKNGLLDYAVYLNDTWQVEPAPHAERSASAATASGFLPDQDGPGRQHVRARRATSITCQQLGPAARRQLSI